MVVDLRKAELLISLFAISIFLSLSCVTHVNNVESPVALPDRFSASGEHMAPDKWWLCFNDAELNSLMDEALSRNFTLQSAWSRLDQAEALLVQARAPLLPQVNTNDSVGKTWTRTETEVTVESEPIPPLNGGTPLEEALNAIADLVPDEEKTRTHRSTDHENNFKFGVSSSYELDLWGRVRSLRNAADLDLQGSREDLMSAAITLTSQVASTWYQLVEQYGQIDLLQQQIAVNKNILDLLTLRFRRGASDSTDVLQQRQLIEIRQGDLALAQSRATTIEHALAILLGKAPTETSTIPHVSQLPALAALPDTGVPATLLQRRPDVLRAYYRVQSSNQRVAAAIAERFPQFSLSGSYSTNDDDWRNLFNTWTTSLAVNIAAPIFDAGRRRAEVTRTQAVVEENLSNYGQNVLNALGEVEDALVQEQRQQEYLASLDRQIGLSDKIVGQIRDSYLKGGIDYLRVLDSQLTQQALQRTQLQARRQLIGYRINLCKALAGGWQLDRPEPLRE